ncbi:GntR family transcriptional regulator [Acuticoccus kandeliae]|uniref:GntR family transcriptional regulator n=1 Tax=Acuticoccus kandeliae TaxID=2073160 RepID=UPI0014745B5A|nr:GntR family transcriptional regulator [Acuticoccus kandeliae]
MLANQILDLVRDKRMERGDRLVESVLADIFTVSRTPVRSALALLCEEGIAEARPNHGYFLLKDWIALKYVVFDVPPSAEDDVYQRIIGDRLAEAIPASVTQAALLERYGANRATLIKTLARMSEEGIITKNKGHGWTFATTLDSGTALKASYEFRMTVEPAAIDLDTFEVDILALDRVRSHHLWLLEQGKDVSAASWQLFEIDAKFHEAIVGFSGNAFFIQAVQQQNRLRRLFEYRGYVDVERVRVWIKEHLAIIDALFAQDRAAARTLLRNHLEKAYRAGLALAERGEAASPSAPGRASETPSDDDARDSTRRRRAKTGRQASS